MVGLSFFPQSKAGSSPSDEAGAVGDLCWPLTFCKPSQRLWPGNRSIQFVLGLIPNLLIGVQVRTLSGFINFTYMTWLKSVLQQLSINPFCPQPILYYYHPLHTVFFQLNWWQITSPLENGWMHDQWIKFKSVGVTHCWLQGWFVSSLS